MISILQLSKRMNYSRQRIHQLLYECEKFSSIEKMKPKRGYIDEVEFFLAYIQLLNEKQEKKFLGTKETFLDLSDYLKS